jgi:hypothetical protein
MVIGRNRPDPTKKTQQFGAAAASYSPRRSRRSNSETQIGKARFDPGIRETGVDLLVEFCVDFTAKRVAVVGTGATAVQAIPEIAQQAKHLTVFQRTANYCVPARNGKVDPDLVKARKADYDGIIKRLRESMFGLELYFIPKSALETTPEERERQFDKRWDTAASPFGSLRMRAARCSGTRPRDGS